MITRSAPLADVKVLDLSPLLPGPFCSQLLGDLGAQVISVEPPAGDHTRHVPGGVHSVVNRNKRSVVFDLKQPADQQQCRQLAAEADVVIEGFRPGVVERLAVDYEQIKALNPRVVYCSISGFGQTGPRRSHPGHDLGYLSASGVMSLAGHWAEAPRRAGVPLADISASLYAALSIVTALYERDRTGHGCYLDVAITDTATALAALRGGPRLDVAPDRQEHLAPQNDLFYTSDGKAIVICALEDHFWQRFRECLARYDPKILDHRFDHEASRRTHGDELHSLIDSAIARRPAADWIEELRAHDVPVEPVLTISEAVSSPQAQARGLVVEVGRQRHIGFPVLRNGAPMGHIWNTAAALGAHTAEVADEIHQRTVQKNGQSTTLER